MFGSTPPPVDPNSKQRYGVSLRSLPPIETLQPETLKDFTKEDLRCYLEAAGMAPGATKPEMKRQMRSLINQATGVEDNIFDSRFNNSFPVVPIQQPFASPVQYLPTLPAPPNASGGSLPNFAEGDIQCADCPKKGNKECHYKRCRTCCLRKMKEVGYRCGPHLRDSDRRPTKVTSFINNQPIPTPTFGTPNPPPVFTPAPTPPTPTPLTPSIPLTRSATMPPPPPRYPVPSLPPTPSTVVTPIQPVPTSSVPPPSLQHPHQQHQHQLQLQHQHQHQLQLQHQHHQLQHQHQHQPHHPPHHPHPLPHQHPHQIPHHIPPSQHNFVLPPSNLQPPTPMEPGEVSPYSVAECPRCHKVVSTLGANLWLHLKECDPDHIMDYVRLFYEGKLATPTLTEKEKTDPLRVAHQSAVQRYQKNMSYLQDIFSSSSVDDLLEWHAKLPSRESEQQKAVATFTAAMEKMVGILDHNNNNNATTTNKDNLDEFHARSATFYEHLQLLDTCTTLEEVAERTREFERVLDISIAPTPVCVRVRFDPAYAHASSASSQPDEKSGGANGVENGKHVSMYDKEMTDVSETVPLSLVAL